MASCAGLLIIAGAAAATKGVRGVASKTTILVTVSNHGEKVRSANRKANIVNATGKIASENRHTFTRTASSVVVRPNLCQPGAADFAQRFERIHLRKYTSL